MKDMEQRCDHLDDLIAREALLRSAWVDGPRGPNGYERACLLAALSPESGESGSAAACPADVMPRFLAELTPWMDDHVSAEY